MHQIRMSSKGTSTNGKLTGISVLNVKKTIPKKINVSFIVPFCLSKYRFSFDTF